MKVSGKFYPPIVILFISLPFPALSDEAIELDDMVVTAALEPMQARDVAGSLTVITAEEIEQRQVLFLSDLLRTVPGFAVSQSGGPGTQTQVRVRGSEANHVLVLVDGMRVNDPASADEFQFQYMLSEQIERVEILRGPQSATWGTDALSAVINIIHRKSVAEPRASMTAETGSWNSRKISATGELGTERYRAWMGVSDFDTDGINASEAGSERDGNKNTTFNAGMDFQLNESVRIGISGRHLDAESEFDDFDFSTGLPADADRLSQASRTYVQGTLQVDPNQSRWSGKLQYNLMNSDNQNYADGFRSGSTAADSIEYAAQVSLAIGSGTNIARRLTLAVDRQEIEYEQRGLASAFGDPNQDQSYDVTGVALEYFARPSERISFSLSARQDRFSDFENARTWQLASNYRLNEFLQLRGSLGTGSKAPTFNERFGFFSGSFKGNPALKPERSSGWELGVDAEILDGWALIGLAWFDQDLENEIDGFVFDPASGLFTASNRAQDSQRQGLELSFEASVGDAVDLGFSYSFTDAAQVSPAGTPVVEIRRPEHMGNMNLNYRFGEDRGNLNFTVRYTGRQFDSFFSPLTFMSEQVELDQHLVGDLAAAWRLKPGLEITARVENIFDQQYEEVLGFARAGRAFYAGFRARFDKLGR